MMFRADQALNDYRSAPNLLTFLRLCLIPFMVLALLDSRYKLAFCLFVIAGITDALDGLLARALGQRTVLGQYLDPVADKLMLSTLFMVLTHKDLMPIRVTVFVFGRDMLIVVVCAILFVSIGFRDFKPALLGKLNTFAQILAIAGVLLRQFYASVALSRLTDALLWSVCGLTIGSGLQYTWQVARRLSNQPMTRS